MIVLASAICLTVGYALGRLERSMLDNTKVTWITSRPRRVLGILFALVFVLVGYTGIATVSHTVNCTYDFNQEYSKVLETRAAAADADDRAEFELFRLFVPGAPQVTEEEFRNRANEAFLVNQRTIQVRAENPVPNLDCDGVTLDPRG
jgi:hypothetical protein